MNASRLIASVGGYFLSAGNDTVAFHLYGGISSEVELSGTRVSLKETSTYPWSGSVAIAVDPEQPAEFTLKLRIPGWADGATASVNGEPVDVAGGTENGYLSIRRRWNAGDAVALDLPMPPQRLFAHPAVRADAGRVALKRGPLVYCVEETDNPGGAVQQLKLPRDAPVEIAERDDLFDGVVTLTADGLRITDADWNGDLYRSEPPKSQPVKLTAIPYYLWNNRQKGSMQIWLCEA
jgi:DUF1680 family protein